MRELQAVETELGVPQTPIEVAMDDWALGTVADLEDRTRLRPVATGPSLAGCAAAPPAPGCRRGTGVRRRPAPSASRAGPRTPVLAEPHDRADGAGSRPLAWVLAGGRGRSSSALGATATLFILLARPTTDIPVVTDIAATEPRRHGRRSAGPTRASREGDTVPDHLADDGRADAEHPGGRRVSSYDADPGETVCVTVTVNRDGKTGTPSAEKCVDVAG